MFGYLNENESAVDATDHILLLKSCIQFHCEAEIRKVHNLSNLQDKQNEFSVTSKIKIDPF